MINSNFVRLFATSLAFISCNSFSSQAHANASEAEFSLCAAAALGDLVSEKTKYDIDLSTLETTDFSGAVLPHHAVHVKLMMTLETVSGESLGDIVCTLDHRGDVVSAMFENELSSVASN